MKIAPANVPDYSNTTDMIAHYQTIHALFWPPVREVIPKTKPKPKPKAPPPPRAEPVPRPEIGATRNDERQTVEATASARPEPAPAAEAPRVEPPSPSLRRLIELPLIDQITRAVCEEFNMTKIELWSERRTLNVVRPRHLAFSLCKHLTTRSLVEIGRRFGGRDHTTVLNGVRKMAPFLEATKDGMPADATLAHWVRVMRHYLEI